MTAVGPGLTRTPSLPLPRWSSVAMRLAPFAAVVGAFELARTLVAGRPVGLVVVGGVAAIGLLARPRVGAVLLIVLACTLWYSPHVPVAVAGSHTDEVEALAYGLIAWWLLGAVLRQDLPGARFYGRTVAVLCLAFVVEVPFSLTHTGEWHRVVADAKTFGLYLLVLPLCAMFGTPLLQQRLESIVLGVATVGSAFVLGAVASGIQLEGRPGTAIDPTDLAATIRVRPALLPIVFLATVIIVGRISAYGLTARRALALSLYLGVWAVSYNRSSWAGLLVALGLVVLFRPGPRRPARTAAAVIAVLIVVPLVFFISSTGYAGPVPKTVATRLETVVNGSAVRSDSYTDRRAEYDDAFRALARQPVFGVGVGGLYGARRPYYDAGLGVIRYEDRPFSHNSWLYLYLQLGLLGLLAAGMLGSALVRAVRVRRREDDLPGALRATSVACALGGMAIEALANPNLLLRPNIIALAVALALVVPVREPS